MKRSVFNIVTGIFAAVYIVLLILGNVFYASIPVVTEPGSYAEKFAKEHGLKQTSVPSSKGKVFDVKYETFSSNITDNNTISIERYKGQSRKLMVPESISGIKVTEIGESFFKDLDVQELYIPETIEKINAKPTKDVTIYCFKDTPFYVDNIDSKDWKLEEIPDTTYYERQCADIPFLYNDYGSYIEIVGYTGSDKIIIIPSYIDGIPVTKVSFDLLGHYDAVCFPETVQEINGKVNKWLFSPTLVIEIVFTILAFVLVIATVNVVLPRYRNNLNEYMLSGPQIVFSILYLVLQVYLSFKYIYLALVTPMGALLRSLILMLAYFAVIFLINRGREQSYKVTAEVKEQTAPVRNLQSMVKGLSDGIKDPEIKKAVSRTVDEIRFTQAKSKDVEVENLVADKITLLKTIIKEGNKEEIIEKCNDIIDLMKNR